MAAAHRTAKYQRDRAALRKREAALTPPARRPCVLCRGRYGPIRYDLPYPHPLSFSADHALTVWVTNTHAGPLRPAHLHCQRQQGGRESHRSRARRRPAQPRPATALRW